MNSEGLVENKVQPRIKIRSFTPEWQKKTEDCIREIIRTQRNNPAVEVKSRYKDIAKYCQRFPNEDFKIAVVEDTNIVSGTVGLRFLKDGVGQLIRFGVRPAFESKGIGSRLFNELMDFAKANHYKEIYLTTEADPEHVKARGMYERRSFKRINPKDMQKEDMELLLSGDDILKHIEDGKTLIYKLELEVKSEK